MDKFPAKSHRKFWNVLLILVIAVVVVIGGISLYSATVARNNTEELRAAFHQPERFFSDNVEILTPINSDTHWNTNAITANALFEVLRGTELREADRKEIANSKMDLHIRLGLIDRDAEVLMRSDYVNLSWSSSYEQMIVSYKDRFFIAESDAWSTLIQVGAA